MKPNPGHLNSRPEQDTVVCPSRWPPRSGYMHRVEDGIAAWIESAVVAGTTGKLAAFDVKSFENGGFPYSAASDQGSRSTLPTRNTI